MERLAPHDLRAVIAALDELDASDGIDAFAGRVLPLLHALVPFDVATYNEVDNRRGRIITITEPLGGLPDDGYERFTPLMSQHPIIQHLRRSHDTRPVKFSDFLSQRQFHQLGLYQDFFRVVGVEHQIAVSLPARPPLLVGIALNRARGDFSERERLLLELMRPQLLRTYRQTQARALVGRTVAALERALEADGRAVVLLARGGRAPLLSALARRWLEQYFGRPLRRSAPLPDDVAG
jgi:hypothetical protein